jgi:hypothetical protein
MIRVTMPAGINIGEVGSIVKLKPKGTPGNISATQGIVRDGNVIEIINPWGTDSKKSNKAPIEIDFVTVDTQNPLSTKNAGKISIMTYTQINGKYYEVDEGNKSSTFSVVAGKIRSTVPIFVKDPITCYKDSVWTIRFSAENITVKGTGIRVKLPADITMNPATSVSGGTCSKWQCPGKKATKNEIWFIVPEDIPANKEIQLDLVGVNNPCSTRPTGTIRVTTWTPDGKFKVDDGYDTNTQMSFLGELVSFSST